MKPSDLKLVESIQPDSIEFHAVDGIFIKSMGLRDAGMLVPQHSHAYAHISMLAKGAVRVWRDDQCLGDFKAPQAIFVQANAKHTFLSLEPDTLIYCIHNISRTGEVEIQEHHEIGGKPCHGV